MQRFSIVKNMVNYATLLMLCVIVLLGLAALFWLATGHHTGTSFTHTNTLAIQPGNFAIFSTVILAFLGANVSMIIGGEIANAKRSHATSSEAVYLCLQAI